MKYHGYGFIGLDYAMKHIRVYIRWYLLAPALLEFACGCAGPSGGSSGSDSSNFSPLSRQSAVQTGRFTIVLGQYSQEDRVEQAQSLQQKARQVLKTEDIWLHNDPEGLMVNYGRFDKETPGSPIQNELQRVRKLYKSLNAGPYQFCYIREISSPDPPAPEEWNLLLNDCDYTIEIASYYNVPDQEYYDRKLSAVEAVRKLRNENRDPAFFIHGQRESRIYVGCISRQEDNSRIEAILRKYPHRFENGFEVFTVQQQKGKKLRTPNKSLVIRIKDLKPEVPF